VKAREPAALHRVAFAFAVSAVDRDCTAGVAWLGGSVAKKCPISKTGELPGALVDAARDRMAHHLGDATGLTASGWKSREQGRCNSDEF
jgi:hypothetical protein